MGVCASNLGLGVGEVGSEESEISPISSDWRILGISAVAAKRLKMNWPKYEFFFARLNFFAR